MLRVLIGFYNIAFLFRLYLIVDSDQAGDILRILLRFF